MLNVGVPEMLVILVVALLVLGPERLPGAARQAGRVMGELRRISSGLQAELRDAMEIDDGPSPRPLLGDPPPLAPSPFPEDPAGPAPAADPAPDPAAAAAPDPGDGPGPKTD